MGVYIPNMKMPTYCGECVLCDEYSLHVECVITGDKAHYKKALEGRMDNCPLVEIPTPHGRLIDERDVLKLIRQWSGRMVRASYEAESMAVDGLPCVIKAEE